MVVAAGRVYQNSYAEQLKNEVTCYKCLVHFLLEVRVNYFGEWLRQPQRFEDVVRSYR